MEGLTFSITFSSIDMLYVHIFLLLSACKGTNYLVILQIFSEKIISKLLNSELREDTEIPKKLFGALLLALSKVFCNFAPSIKSRHPDG